jgi:hypothetical protein
MVLVCHPHRFIFMKTHKTAGTSVEMYLERFCVPEDRYAGTEAVAETVTEVGIVGSRRSGKTRSDTWVNHMPAERVRALLGPEIWDGYTKITSVRNPYARMLSHYFWLHDQHYPIDDVGFERARAGFAGFVKGGWFGRRKWTNDLEIVAVDGRVAMDAFVRQEHLADDLAALCTRLGLPWEPERLPVTKQRHGDRARYPLAAYYTPETRDIVRREFDWVFSLFDYALPVPEPAH